MFLLKSTNLVEQVSTKQRYLGSRTSSESGNAKWKRYSEMSGCHIRSLHLASCLVAQAKRRYLGATMILIEAVFKKDNASNSAVIQSERFDPQAITPRQLDKKKSYHGIDAWTNIPSVEICE